MNTVRHILEIKGYDVWSISPQATVFKALRLMADKDVGALLVMTGEKLLGILSERDYARKVVLQNKISKETLVSDIMTEKVFSVHPDQTAHEVMTLMTEKHIRHLPVIENEKVIGMISIGDVLRNVIYQQKTNHPQPGRRDFIHWKVNTHIDVWEPKLSKGKLR